MACLVQIKILVTFITILPFTIIFMFLVCLQVRVIKELYENRIAELYHSISYNWIEFVLDDSDWYISAQFSLYSDLHYLDDLASLVPSSLKLCIMFKFVQHILKLSCCIKSNCCCCLKFWIHRTIYSISYCCCCCSYKFYIHRTIFFYFISFFCYFSILLNFIKSSVWLLVWFGQLPCDLAKLSRLKRDWVACRDRFLKPCYGHHVCENSPFCLKSIGYNARSFLQLWWTTGGRTMPP